MIPKPPISIYKKIHLYKKMIPKPSIEINLKQHSTKFPRWGTRDQKMCLGDAGRGKCIWVTCGDTPQILENIGVFDIWDFV